jgi:hypothetical protein
LLAAEGSRNPASVVVQRACGNHDDRYLSHSFRAGTGQERSICPVASRQRMTGICALPSPRPAEMDSVIGEDDVEPLGMASMRRRKKSAAARRVTFSCS